LLFIFSGLIKLNDPIGTQYKLEEYFEVFAADLPALHDFFISLVPLWRCISPFSFAQPKWFWVLRYLLPTSQGQSRGYCLSLLSFSRFLTFYSAYFNKVTDCGCFGAAIKLTPWTSFGKDIFLLVLILVIVYYRKKFKAYPTGIIVVISTLVSLGVAVYALRHLPIIDLLPYRVGASIPAQMKPSEPLRYLYIFEKDGKKFEYEQYPSDTTLVFKEMVVLNEDAKPKITDYKVWNDAGDYTESTFQGKSCFLIIKSLSDINTAALPDMNKLINAVKSKGVETVILTSGNSADIANFLSQHQLTAPYYFVDATVLKTISRSNPGLWLLKDGTVKGKWHYNDTPTAEEVVGLAK
jgi:hypothetical protein